MDALRRLYVYTVSMVSLLAVAWGFGSLLETALREVEDALGGSVVAGGGTGREQLSLSIALIAVGGPVWLVHWWLARRGMRADGAAGLGDRASTIRAWYMALVRAVSLGVGVWALVTVLSTVAGRLLGVADPYATWSGPLASALVAWPVWAVTTRSWAAEIRATPMAGGAARVTRLYRYGALYATLLIVLVGAAGLVSTILSVLVGRPEFGLADTWWRQAALSQASAILVGLAAWMLHWHEAAAAVRDADRIGEDDRLTHLRAAYFGGTLLTATAWSAVVVAGSLADLGRRVAGLTTTDTMSFLEEVVGPPLAVAPVIVAGWWHARRATREARDLGALHQAGWRRIARLLVSLVGLALLAWGSIGLIELVLTRLAGGTETSMTGDTAMVMRVPGYLAQLVVGAILWLPAWAGILADRARDIAAEQAASATRAHLFLVVGASLVSAVPTGVLILYSLLNAILGGVPVRPLLAELSSPMAILAVAVAIGTYHARLLLGDLRAGAPDRARAHAVPATWAAPEPVVAVPRAGAFEIMIRLPADGPAEAWLVRMQEQLPTGATMEVRHLPAPVATAPPALPQAPA